MLRLCVIMILLVAELSSMDAFVSQKGCDEAGITFQSNGGGTVEVEVGGLVLVPCQFSYNGSQNGVRKPFPFWQLDYNFPERTVFLYQGAFPVNFSYNESAGGLIISNVNPTLNGTVVSCAFDFFYTTDHDICKGNSTVITVINEHLSINLTLITLSEATITLPELNSLDISSAPQVARFNTVIGEIIFMLSIILIAQLLALEHVF